jgi:Fic family protein
MEGADSDRREAEEMLTTGRKPRDRSEMMIAKNYAALQFVLKRSAEELSPEMILELHRVLTEGTFDDPEASGRFQTPDDERAVVYWKDGTLFHQPPPAEELPLRIRELCDFANNVNQQGFIHPIVKAIIIHFFIRYDHPFEGGNGRVSRALFYWSMLHDHYWLMKYLSISSILIQNSSKDPRSYLYSRTDDHDITYFIIFQLGVIERAIQSLYEQFAQESAESGAIERLVHGSARLNPRQIAALQSALQDGSESFTIAGQAGRHGVTQETARSDLMGLAALGLFTKGKVKNRFVFRPADGLAGRLRDLRST